MSCTLGDQVVSVVEAKRRRAQASDSQPKFVPPKPSDTRPKPEKHVLVPPLPGPKVVGVAVEHFEARPHGSVLHLPGPMCTLKGDNNVVAFVDAGVVLTAFCHDPGWFRVTCDRCTLGGMSEWVPRKRFIPRLDLEQEDAFCSEHGEGSCTGDENWFTGW